MIGPLEQMEDDLANITLVNETFSDLIKSPEDSYVDSKEDKINTIVTALKKSSDKAVHIILDDIIRKERLRRFEFISKKRRSDLEYTNKIKMIELRVFVVKFTFLFIAFLLFVTYFSNLYFSHKAGVEPVGLYEIMKLILGNVIDLGEE